MLLDIPVTHEEKVFLEQHEEVKDIIVQNLALEAKKRIVELGFKSETNSNDIKPISKKI
jgi:hypothetical protein